MGYVNPLEGTMEKIEKSFFRIAGNNESNRLFSLVGWWIGMMSTYPEDPIIERIKVFDAKIYTPVN